MHFSQHWKSISLNIGTNLVPTWSVGGRSAVGRSVGRSDGRTVCLPACLRNINARIFLCVCSARPEVRSIHHQLTASSDCYCAWPKQVVPCSHGKCFVPFCFLFFLCLWTMGCSHVCCGPQSTSHFSGSCDVHAQVGYCIPHISWWIAEPPGMMNQHLNVKMPQIKIRYQRHDQWS
jgi:hypothetical protein